MIHRVFYGLALVLGLFLTAIPAAAQYTQVTATVRDSNGTAYTNCSYSVDFVNQSSLPQLPLLSGSAFQQSYGGARCDSTGALSIRIPDNNQITPTPSQWKFSICSSAGTTCFTLLVTITGASQDITAQIVAAAPLLNPTLNLNTVNALVYLTGNNAVNVDTASMTNGSAVLTATGSPFTAAMVGRVVEVAGALGGQTLRTTVLSFQNANQLTLNASATATVTTVRAIIGTDDTAGMQAALTAAAGKTLLIPCGVSTLLTMSVSTLSLSSGTTIQGYGSCSRIYVTGDTGAVNDNNHNIFVVTDGASNVTVAGLRFTGLNFPNATPNNEQSNVIFGCGCSTPATDVNITGNIFENLFGFSVHNAGNGTRWNFRSNVVSDVANGVNINSDYSIQSHNALINSESFEASGNYVEISDNTLKCSGLPTSALCGEISVGGNTGVGAKCYGARVTHNAFTGTGKAGGSSLVVAQCSTNTVVQGNTLDRSVNVGILVDAGSGVTQDILIDGNTLTDIGLAGAAAPTCFQLNGTSSNVLRVSVTNNKCLDSGSGTYQLKFGVNNSVSTNTYVAGNTFSVLNNWFLQSNASATATLGANQVLAGTYSVTGGTVTPATYQVGINVAGTSLTGVSGTGNICATTNCAISPVSVTMGSEALTAIPRAFIPCFFPGALTSTWFGCAIGPGGSGLDKAITVTRITAQLKTPPVGCATAAKIRLSDGTNNQDVTLVNGNNTDDSGAISQVYAAAAQLTIQVQTAASGCGTNPQDVNVIVQFRTN